LLLVCDVSQRPADEKAAVSRPIEMTGKFIQDTRSREAFHGGYYRRRCGHVSSGGRFKRARLKRRASGGAAFRRAGTKRPDPRPLESSRYGRALGNAGRRGCYCSNCSTDWGCWLA
jgi:hypothetical protein